MGFMAQNTRSFAVLRRRTASLAILSAAFAIALAVGPAPAHAASIVSEMLVNGVDTIVPNGTAGSTEYAYYQLINPRSTTVGTGGAAINDLVVSTVVPPNSIQPINATTSPLSIVSGSFGFDQSNLQVFLTPTDAKVQEIALLFGNGGLAPGGTLDFKVSLEPGYSSLMAPTLTLQPPYADLSTTAPQLMSYTPNVAGGAPPTSAPEPIPLALWSVLAGAGLLRARAFRRSRRSASASASVEL
jgi:hypothetical protein